MTNILKQTNNTKNGLIGSTVTFPGSGTATGSPLTVGQVYTTNTTAGQFLTSGSNGTTWTNSTTIADNILVAKNNPPELEVKGRMVINGRDLEERLDTIEKVLHIPERDVILEKKHPKLKKLYEEYINELSKYKMWHSIKGDND
jgi:hypothetical protein